MAVSDTVAINSFRSPPICVCLSHLGTTVDGRNPTTAYQLVQDDLPTTAVLICCCWFRWGKKNKTCEICSNGRCEIFGNATGVTRSKEVSKTGGGEGGGGGEAVFALARVRRPSFFCFSDTWKLFFQ